SPRLILQNPDTTITTATFCSKASGACLPTDGSTALVLPQTGTYTIEATSNSLSPVAGTYTLTLVSVFSLSITKAGSGTVTSGPAGINCGVSCSSLFPSGATITLTATAASGSSFTAGWSGAGCSGTGTCMVTMNDDKSVTATFSDNPCSTSPITLG